MLCVLGMRVGGILLLLRRLPMRRAFLPRVCGFSLRRRGLRVLGEQYLGIGSCFVGLELPWG